MVCYCKNARHGFLDKKGIATIKSGLVSGIFKQEMTAIYARQTKRRDELKAESKKVIEQLLLKIATCEVQTAGLEKMLVELSENLKGTKGKRVYGYLPPRTKKLVDSITDELAKEPTIAHAYKLWCEIRSEITASYRDAPEPILPLSQQKEFKSIKNHIIYEADRLAKGEISFAELDEMAQPEESPTQDEIITDNSFPEPIDSEEESEMEESTAPYVKWTEDYKQARVFIFGDEEHEPDFVQAIKLLQAESQNGNMLAVFDLGRMYADGLGVEIDTDKAQEYYKQALDGFLFLENKKPWKYLEYRIGKMVAQGLGAEQDYELAAEWFQKSANEKYKFAEYSLGGLYYRGQGVEQSYEKAFELYLRSAKQGFPYADFEVAKMFRDAIGTEKDEQQSNHHFEKAYVGFASLEKQSHDDKILYRLGWMRQNGIGTEKDIPKAKEYFEKSAKLGNPFACYSWAKLILAEDNPTTEELQTALKYLQTASDSGNEFAQYSLAKLNYKGEHLEQNIAKAVELFSLSAEQGNEYAQFFFDNMDKWKEPAVSFTVTRLMHQMSRIFENNQPPQKASISLQIDSKRMRKLREKKMAQGHKQDDHEQRLEY